MADLVRIENGDTFKIVMDLLKKAEGSSVYIAFDELSTSLAQVHYIKMLKKVSEELDKKIIIMSDDAQIRAKSRKIGLPAVGGQDSFFKGYSAKTNNIKQSDIVSVKKNNLESTPVKKNLKNKKPIISIKDTPLQSPAEWISKKSKNLAEPSTGFNKKTKRNLFLVSIFFALLAGLLATTFIFQNADITVYATKQQSSYSTDVVIDTSINANTENTIVGIPLGLETTQSGTFNATGKANKGEKSKGQVTIFSSFNNTLTLKSATTYLEASDGKRYSITSDIQGLKNGVPYIIEVVAQVAGDDSNLASGERLEIHNVAFGFRPDILYAVATNGTTGGTSDEMTVISDSDFVQAREYLRGQIVRSISEKLTEEYLEDIIVLNSFVSLSDIEESFSSSIGSEVSNFNFTIKAKLSGIAFAKKDLEEVIKQDFKNKATASQIFIDVDLNLDDHSTRSWDPQKGIAVASINYLVNWYTQIDNLNIKTLLANRTIPQIKDFLIDKPEISGVSVSLSPFWVKKTPKSTNKIDITVEVK